ncbi:GNAT family N-acetyltransferase [Haloferax profundi]|uniref:Acetyltransferase n=1 Tax=Haloferax profundi TaxID=1544718 RepID=A0A0W1SSS5_9EURY|nr:GNAT family N-acetyltransferase [Haloferax profundi]KTG29421.1 acetyltransferase [Haloferax profundi]
MTIRVATEEDIDAIRHVAKASWETDYPEILTRETIEEGFNDWYAHEQIADALVPARSLLLVAERDDAVVGFAHATWSSDEGEGYILRLYVHPDYRRQNVGHELLNRTRVELAEAGVDRINAMVLAENDPGNNFYDQFGFEYVDESQTTIGGDSYRENRYVLE